MPGNNNIIDGDQVSGNWRLKFPNIVSNVNKIAEKISRVPKLGEKITPAIPIYRMGQK